MPEPLLPYVQQVSGIERMPTVQPAGQTAVRNLQNLAQDTSQFSEGLYQRIKTNELLQAQTKMAQGISRIEMEHQGDPGIMSQAFDSFRKGLTHDIQDQEVKAQIDAQYQTSVLPAINRATAQYKQRTDEEAAFNTNLRLVQLQDDATTAAKESFSADPQIAQNARIRAFGITKQIQTLVTQKNSDGNFMFGADQAAKMFVQAYDNVHVSLLEQRIKESKNPLAEAERLINGGMAYTVPGSEQGFAGISGQSTENIFDSMVQEESGGNQNAVSPKGAVGVAQVMPGTAPEAAKLAGLPWDETRYRTDAAYNKALGLAYFKNMQEKFGDNTLAIMAYNAGATTVQDFIDGTNVSGKNPGKDKLGDPRKGEITDSEFAAQFPIQETRDYVRKVKRGVGVSTVDVMGAFSPAMRQNVQNSILKIAQETAAERRRNREAEEADQKLQAQSVYDSLLGGMSKLPSQETDPIGRSNAVNQLLTNLNASRNILMIGGKEKEADALYKMIVSGGASQDDPVTVTSIMNLQQSGLAADDVIQNAMLNGKLTNQTAMAFLDISKLSGRQSASSAEKEGLDRVSQALNSQLTKDPNKGAQVAYAQQKYLERINNWKSQNPGEPLTREVTNWASADTLEDTEFFKGTLYSYGFPSFIDMQMLDPQVLYAKNPEAAWDLAVNRLKNAAKIHFQNKHNGNKEEMMKDPETKQFDSALLRAESAIPVIIANKKAQDAYEKTIRGTSK